ncbi:hypothetical protein DPMN_086458 [Dreissena polymorpha]|uniref:Uncharacterized protein n=1 Tax=Dreissena polymorpha TaxID=45954 RepID=A0A9D4KR87_DREPO|nr:hypothetical protein DPMN_086458 [Dreissena polymorpha]
MHDWAAVNSWSRYDTKTSVIVPRPMTKATQGYGRYSVNIPVITPLPLPKSGLRRCHTTLLAQVSSLEKQQVYKPKKRFVESSTTHYIHYLQLSNKESEEKLKRTINVLRMQRSKSDLDVSRDQTKDISGMGLIGGAFFKEKSPLFHNSLGDREKLEGGPAPTSGQKQEMKLGVAVVPRKGLIALSTSDDTSDTVDAKRHPTNGTDPQLINFAQLHTPGTKSRQTTLIKRADIMVHVKAGAKLLEDAEQHQIQEEELEKNLENYTILDLQTEILGMTDPKAVRRTSPPLDGQNTDNTLTPRSKLGKREKPITLPAIKNINPFAMKT